MYIYLDRARLSRSQYTKVPRVCWKLVGLRKLVGKVVGSLDGRMLAHDSMYLCRYLEPGGKTEAVIS